MYTHEHDSHFCGPPSRKTLHQRLKLQPPSPRRAKKHHRGRQTLAYLARNGKFLAVATRRRTKPKFQTDGRGDIPLKCKASKQASRHAHPHQFPHPNRHVRTFTSDSMAPRGGPGDCGETATRAGDFLFTPNTVDRLWFFDFYD